MPQNDSNKEKCAEHCVRKLVSVLINKAQCQSNLVDNITLMSSLPAERLLRGSNDEDRRPIEAIMHNLNAQIQNEYKEKPTVFFNTEESKWVRLTESDLVTDPVTGQTLIKHITEGNEETDYLMRPTDVAIQNLQGFLIDDEPITTESDAKRETKKLPAETAIEDRAGQTEATVIPNESDDYTKPHVLPDSQTDVIAPVTESLQDTITVDSVQTTQIIESQTKHKDVNSTPNASLQKADTYAHIIQDVESTTQRRAAAAPGTLATEPDKMAAASGRAGAQDGGGAGAPDALGRSLDENRVSAVPLARADAPARPAPKLSKRDTLRGWLQDPWLRSPVGLLVPLRAGSLSSALAVWREVAQPEGLNLTDLLLIGYDANGISWVSKHSPQGADGVESVTSALLRLLQKYQNLPPQPAGDATLNACARAARRLPYDSALFVIADTAPSDAQRLPAALRAVIEKRLKLYTIWTDPLFPSAASELAASELKRASVNTEGEFLDYHPTIAISSLTEGVPESLWMHKRTSGGRSYRTGRLEGGVSDNYETLLVRRINGGGPASLGVPVEAGVEGLRVRIDGPIDRAVLYPPSGPPVDLLNATAVAAFAPGSRVECEKPLEVALVFPQPRENGDDRYTVRPVSGDEKRPTVGQWRLSVRCSGCEYRALVTARAQIGLDADILGEGVLHLRARGPIASVRETSLIDEYGTEVAKLPFSHQPKATEERLQEVDPVERAMSTLVADVPIPGVRRSSKLYAKIVGRDIYGESFTRVSGPIFKGEVRTIRSATISFPEDARAEELQPTDQNVGFPETQQDRAQRLAGYNETDGAFLTGTTTTAQILSQAGTLLTAAQIGLSSRLYGAPGDNLQLHFEVTNYRERSVRFRFEATGNLRFLRAIRPTSQWVSSGQTVNVIVDVGITGTAQVGARDLITFTATGLDQVSISAFVYVTNPEVPAYDVWSPIVRHTFQGDCILKMGDDCARHSWAATVYARDRDLGLLRLSSSPVGLRYENGFTSGTREEVVGTYRATCCAPRLLINAVDAIGNANTYTIDITYYIPGAAIAAITLGVLLFIALVALIVFLVIICLRRRRESRALPSYATSRRETS